MRDYEKNPVAPSELMAGKFVELVHGRGRDIKDGPYFTDLRQVVDHPRARVCNVVFQNHRRPSRTDWVVDGLDMDSVDAAAAFLNANPLPQPPATTIALLAIVFPAWSGEPTWVQPPADLNFERFRQALEMALIEAKREPDAPEGVVGLRVKLTDIGQAVLERQYPGGSQ